MQSAFGRKQKRTENPKKKKHHKTTDKSNFLDFSIFLYHKMCCNERVPPIYLFFIQFIIIYIIHREDVNVFVSVQLYAIARIAYAP